MFFLHFWLLPHQPGFICDPISSLRQLFWRSTISPSRSDPMAFPWPQLLWLIYRFGSEEIFWDASHRGDPRLSGALCFSMCFYFASLNMCPSHCPILRVFLEIFVLRASSAPSLSSLTWMTQGSGQQFTDGSYFALSTGRIVFLCSPYLGNDHVTDFCQWNVRKSATCYFQAAVLRASPWFAMFLFLGFCDHWEYVKIEPSSNRVPG